MAKARLARGTGAFAKLVRRLRRVQVKLSVKLTDGAGNVSTPLTKRLRLKAARR